MTITSLLCLAYLYDFIWNHLKSTFLWIQIHINNVVLLYHQNFFFFFPENSICNIKSFLILKLILKCSAKGRSKIRVVMDRWLQIKVGLSFLSFPILLLMLPPASAFAVVKNAFQPFPAIQIACSFPCLWAVIRILIWVYCADTTKMVEVDSRLKYSKTDLLGRTDWNWSWKINLNSFWELYSLLEVNIWMHSNNFWKTSTDSMTAVYNI